MRQITPFLHLGIQDNTSGLGGGGTLDSKIMDKPKKAHQLENHGTK